MPDSWRNLVDRAVAALVLVVVSPLLVVVTLAVLLTSRGPVIFRQVRVGRDGRPFRIYKFRTMRHSGATGSGEVAPAGDPRVTPVGRFLRAWYLDELPQFVNVLKGDMALVGPRPETPDFVALYTPHERRVLMVRPGIVGPSTVAFVDEADRLADTDDPLQHYRDVLLHERVRLDLACLHRRTWWEDLQLLTRQALSIARR